MDADAARRWLILWSLVITAAVFVFFIIAPLTGFPLSFEQTRSLIQLILPVFLGYLGSASYFVFPRASRRARYPSNSELIGLMVRGPVIVFAIVSVVAISTFGFSNRPSAVPGTGMTIEMLSTILSAALGLLAVTTNVAVAYLFTSEQERRA